MQHQLDMQQQIDEMFCVDDAVVNLMLTVPYFPKVNPLPAILTSAYLFRASDSVGMTLCLELLLPSNRYRPQLPAFDGGTVCNMGIIDTTPAIDLRHGLFEDSLNDDRV